MFLPDREAGSVAGQPIFVVQREGEAAEPALQELLDLLGAEWITDPLQAGRMGAFPEAVV